jgi:hypothetical protein
MFAEEKEVQYWPEDLLTTAAECFLMADTALEQWRHGQFEEGLITAHTAQQAAARLTQLLKEPPLEPLVPLQESWPQRPLPSRSR